MLSEHLQLLSKLLLNYSLISRIAYSKLTTAPFSFVSYTPTDFSHHRQLPPGAQANATAMEAKHHSAFERVNLNLNAVEDLEQKMGITERWTPAHTDFQKAFTYVQN
jgi:hypothetical protein